MVKDRARTTPALSSSTVDQRALGHNSPSSPTQARVVRIVVDIHLVDNWAAPHVEEQVLAFPAPVSIAFPGGDTRR